MGSSAVIGAEEELLTTGGGEYISHITLTGKRSQQGDGPASLNACEAILQGKAQRMFTPDSHVSAIVSQYPWRLVPGPPTDNRMLKYHL
jgi:hypothetical protein